MNTVKRYVDPHNPWWKYCVEHADTEHPLISKRELPIIRPFATAQGAANYIAERFPGVQFTWDTRDPEQTIPPCPICGDVACMGNECEPPVDDDEQRDLDRWEEARSDAREDARLEREEQ